MVVSTAVQTRGGGRANTGKNRESTPYCVFYPIRKAQVLGVHHQRGSCQCENLHVTNHHAGEDAENYSPGDVTCCNGRHAASECGKNDTACHKLPFQGQESSVRFRKCSQKLAEDRASHQSTL